MITNHPTMTEFEVQRSKLTDILNNYTCRVVKNTSCLFTKRSQGVEFAATEDKSSQKLGGNVEPKTTKLWVHSVRYVHSCVAPTHPTLSQVRGKNNLEIKKINARDVGMGFEIIFPVLRMFTIFFYTVQCPSIWPSARLPASKCHDKLPPPQKCL